MNNVVKNTFIFTAGAAIGSAVTFILLRSKCEQIIQEEVEAMREFYSETIASEAVEVEQEVVDKIKDEPKPVADTKKPDFTGYATRLKEGGYTNYSDIFSKDKEGTQETMDRPYVIAPEEFGDIDDYERISLTYYSDKVLTDEDDELIEDVDDIVGLDSLNTFGQYEDDSVYVRNDRLKCDYEILLDERDYSDIARKPYQTEV